MARLTKQFEKAFARLPEFRFARAYAHREFGSLIAPLSDECCAYILMHDERGGNGPLRVDVWIAPLDSPDDGLDALMVGYRFGIASIFDVDDTADFFMKCAERVEILFPSLEGLCGAIVRELENPPFKTRRWYVYRREIASIKMILRLAHGGGCTPAESAIAHATQCVSGESTYSEFESACRDLALYFIEQNLLSPEASEFYQGNVSFLAPSFVRQLYARALVGKLPAK